MISTSLPSARRQWVKSDCQHSLGAAASNRIHELRGRLRGSGTTRPRRVEDASDGRARRGRQPLALQVPGDRDRSRVKPVGDQLPTEGDDPVADRVRRVARVGQGSAGTWLEGVEPTVAVAADQARELLSADPVRGRRGSDGQLLGDDLEDGHPMLRHASDCHACRDSSDSHHLTHMS